MNIESVHRDPDGVTFESDERTLRVEAVTDAVVRVVYTGDSVEPPEESPMVASLPDEDVDWTLGESEDRFTLATDGVTLEIDRETAAFTWRDGDGNRLVREPEDGGKDIAEVTPADLATGDDISSPRDSVDRTAYETKLDLEFSDEEGIYGLGQHEEGISNYRGHTQDLYQTCTKVAMPAIVSTRGYGIMWDSFSLSTFHDDQHGSYFWTECDNQQEFYFVAGPDLDDVVAGFRTVTGQSSLFPRWAFGYLQSKERYEDQEEILSVAREYRDREIPFDVIVQDWRYWADDDEDTDYSPIEQPDDGSWGEWGQKSFDPDRFPDPSGMLAELHGMDAKYMISIWPNMLSGSNRREMEDGGFLMDEENVSPSPRMEQGFTNVFDPDARKLYWKQAKEGLWDHGVDAWWCDSPEPYHADWDIPVKMQPFERTRFNADTLKSTIDAEFINAYSLYHSQGMYEGQRSVTDEKRVVNLTRSASLGQHRYGAITWSGDISATWEVFENQIADGLQFTATGNPKWTLDIGGFFTGGREFSWFKSGAFQNPEHDDPTGEGPEADADDPTKGEGDGHAHKDPGYRELYVRWFQYGAFLPMFRSHGTHTPREMWRFGEPGETTYDTLVKFDELRYRLMPYIYSVAGWETHEDYTMYRHLAFEFQDDPEVYDITDQFMFGPSLLVCPVTEPMYYEPGGAERSTPIEGKAKAREVYLPEGTDWVDFWSGEHYDGGQTIVADAPLEKIPLFVPEGGVVPMGPVVQHTGETDDTPWQVRVYPGADGAFEVYEDAGDGYDYEDGAYAATTLSWDDATGTLTIAEREGSFPELVERREVEAVLVGEGRGVGHEPADDPVTASYDGIETTLEL